MKYLCIKTRNQPIIDKYYGCNACKGGQYMKLLITDVRASQLLDSRGNPTVGVEVEVEGNVVGRAIVPSGASTGEHEAHELRDNDTAYMGKGVLNAVNNVNSTIRKAMIGKNALNQICVDTTLINMDGTENKKVLGANAILGVSMAVADAASKALNIPLYRHIGGIYGNKMPIMMMNIINGGVHAKNKIDFQEFMIMPISGISYEDNLKIGMEVYHNLKMILEKEGYNTAVGDEGGFAPDLKNADEVFEILMKAVEKAGYKPYTDVVFAMDAAASELYNYEAGLYEFKGEGDGITPINRNTDDMIAYYEKLVEKYPLVSIEDGLDQNDWNGWKKLTERIGHKAQLVGDDLFVTNPKRLKEGIEKKVANAILIKVNQIGTLSEAMEAIELAKNAGYKTIISHRSGETEDTFIADLAVGVNAGQIKTGAPCRGERTAKYNRLLMIEKSTL